MRPAALLMVLLFLSGCSTPSAAPAQTEPEADDSPGPVLAFEAPRSTALVPNTQHEAFLAVSPDGRTLLTCAHGDFVAPVHMYASTDGGDSFAKLDAGPMVPAGDCEVALSAGGAWSFAGKTNAGIAVATTQDQGATWTVNHLAGPALNGLADRQWLAYVGDTLLLSYQPGSQRIGEVLLTRSADFGSTWTTPEAIVTMDAARPAVSVGDFLVGPGSQEVRIPLARAGLGPEDRAQVSFLVSNDAGVTWASQETGLQSDDIHVSGAALGLDGRLSLAFVQGDALMLSSSGDGGATWSDPVVVATGIGWPRPWASARPDGLVDLVWLSTGEEFGRGPGLALARLDPASSTPVVARTIVADIDFIEYASVAHDGAGRAYVVAVDAPSLIIQQEVSTDQDGDLLLVREVVSGP